MRPEQKAKYEALAHAMQSGVAMKMNYKPGETEPKHLRVGVNAAMSDMGGLARLLIRKGIITEDEYVDAMIESMAREVKSYEAELSALLNTTITLG